LLIYCLEQKRLLVHFALPTASVVSMSMWSHGQAYIARLDKFQSLIVPPIELYFPLISNKYLQDMKNGLI